MKRLTSEGLESPSDPIPAQIGPTRRRVCEKSQIIEEPAAQATSKTMAGAFGRLTAQQLKSNFGSSSHEFVRELSQQLARAASRGEKLNTDALHFGLGAVRGAQPTDTIEAMLVSQMVVTHIAMMDAAFHLKNCDNFVTHEVASRILLGLTRTYTAQMDALTRYRSGGKGEVKVGNVTVNEGGQAIVGNVSGTKKEADGK